MTIEERYPSQQAYIDIVKRAVDELVKEGFLLPEDGESYIEMAKKNLLDPYSGDRATGYCGAGGLKKEGGF